MGEIQNDEGQNDEGQKRGTSDGIGSMSYSDTDAFEEMMAEIVYGAFREGIDVEGGWDISAEKSDSFPDFSMEIYRVKR